MLPNLFDRKISDIDFDNKRRMHLTEEGVKIRDREQPFYYEVYRSTIGVPHPVDVTGKICPQCSSNVAEKMNYCRTCGAYPV